MYGATTDQRRVWIVNGDIIRQDAQHVPLSGYQGGVYQAVPVAPGDQEADYRAVCFQALCPCCPGDPHTSQFWANAVKSWFGTCVGLTAAAQMLLYFSMAAYCGRERIPSKVLLQFGAMHSGLGLDWELYRAISSSLLCDQLFNLATSMFMIMQFGYSMEVTAKWGTVGMALVLYLSVATSSLVASLVLPEGVMCTSANLLSGLLGARVAWVFTNWHLPQHDPRFRVPNPGPDGTMWPVCCPETGARVLTSTEKNIELCQYFLIGSFCILPALMQPSFVVSIPLSAVLSGFLVGGCIFMYKLRKVHAEVYDTTFSRWNPEILALSYVFQASILLFECWRRS